MILSLILWMNWKDGLTSGDWLLLSVVWPNNQQQSVIQIFAIEN